MKGKVIIKAGSVQLGVQIATQDVSNGLTCF